VKKSNEKWLKFHKLKPDLFFWKKSIVPSRD